MNMSGSECSSGCESGWTMYLDTSSNSENRFDYYRNRGENVGLEEEDEDLSMVSDASSGPRHFQEDEQNGYYSLALENTKKMKKELKDQKSKKQSSCFLDDTASSPFFNFSMNNVGVQNDQTEHVTQGFSTTQFKGKSALQKHNDVTKPEGGDAGKSGGVKKMKKWK